MGTLGAWTFFDIHSSGACLKTFHGQVLFTADLKIFSNYGLESPDPNVVRTPSVSPTKAMTKLTLGSSPEESSEDADTFPSLPTPSPSKLKRKAQPFKMEESPRLTRRRTREAVKKVD